MRLPLLPTLFVALAVPVMLGLGVWQLQRAQWKAALLAQLSAAEAQPRLALGGARLPDGLGFRAVSIWVDCPAQSARPHAGRSRAGVAGYVMIIACRTATGEPLQVNAGWAPRPAAATDAVASRLGGRLVAQGGGSARYLLVADAPLPGLEPSAAPSRADIPDNHRLYALQWFFFAASLLVIYLLYLRRMRRSPDGD